MKNKRNILIAVMIILTLVFLCLGITGLVLLEKSENGGGNKAIYFYSDGTEFRKINTLGNEFIPMPQVPVKDGYYFDGWFYDFNDWLKPFNSDDFLTEALEQNVTVYAKFIKLSTKGVITAKFTVDGQDFAKVTGYNGSGAEVHVGEYAVIDGEKLKITEIGAGAFESKNALNSVDLPDSIITIGAEAFKNCTNLTEITIPLGVENIGRGVLSGCNYIKEITIPHLGQTNASAGNSHLAYLFGGAVYSDNAVKVPSSLETVTILRSQKIENNAFYGCANLKNVNLPSVLKEIGYAAFAGCGSLESIVIPEGITEIGKSAFIQCAKLLNITMPESVINVGSNAFYATKWYNDHPNGMLYLNKVAYMYKGGTNLETLVIREGTSIIADNAFGGCTAFKQIILPSSLKRIGEAAFNGSAIERIIIPIGVTHIGGGAFGNCPTKLLILARALSAPIGWVDWVENDGNITILYGYSGT